MVYSLTGTPVSMTTLGIVTSEEIKKDANLFQQPMPLYPTKSLVAIDFFGAMRTIVIEGTYTPTAANEFGINTISGYAFASGSVTDDMRRQANIECFINELDNLVCGQQITLVYHSDSSGGLIIGIDTIEPPDMTIGARLLTGYYHVLINSTEWTKLSGEVNMVKYSINMLEADQTIAG